MMRFGNLFLNKYISSLINDGESIIRKASLTNDTKKKSENMVDAYGCAVYNNGILVEKRYVNPIPKSKGPHHGWKKMGIPENTGRGYLEEFFSSYKPKEAGLVLICVNVIYYTSILENGAQGRPKVPISRKYRIISQMRSDFEALSKKYKGSIVESING